MQWSRLKEKIRLLVMQNPHLCDIERHYICWILKHQKVYSRVIQRKRLDLPPHFQGKGLNVKRLHNLNCRLTRRHKQKKCRVRAHDIFSVTNKAYKYVPGGIRLSTEVPNRRVFIPLTDKNRYDAQMLLKFTNKNRIVFHVPLQQKVRQNIRQCAAAYRVCQNPCIRERSGVSCRVAVAVTSKKLIYYKIRIVKKSAYPSCW